MSFHDFIERVWAYGIKPKSRRKITAQQMYPWAVERQLQADLKAEFTKAGLYYKELALKGTQSFKDNADDLANAEYDNDERIRPIAERVAYEIERFQQACFENFTDVVIGERYVPAVVGPSITETWENNFLTLCRSANDDLKRRVSEIISDAVMNGNNIADTARQIDEAVGHYSYSKAMTIARTETGKLNMAISKAQMEEAGIDKYEWSCMMDERSRPSHEKMDGKVCIWSNPNVVYNIKTKKTEPRPQSAVHLHPGDDYNCRCVALPWDELIEEELNQKKGKPNKQWLELKEQEKRKRETASLNRKRLVDFPIFGEKIVELIYKNSAADEYAKALGNDIGTATVKYDKVIKTSLTATTKDKLEAISHDIVPYVKVNRWIDTKKGDLSLDLLKKESRIEGIAYGFYNIDLRPDIVEDIFSALKKFSSDSQQPLSQNEANAILAFWHEMNHLMDKQRLLKGPQSASQVSFVEVANEYISRHTIDYALKTLNGLSLENSAIMHSKEVLQKCDYDPMAKKLELMVDRFSINPSNFATNLRHFVDETDIYTRDFAIKMAFDMSSQKPVMKLSVNSLIDKIIDPNVNSSDFETLLNP